MSILFLCGYLIFIYLFYFLSGPCISGCGINFPSMWLLLSLSSFPLKKFIKELPQTIPDEDEFLNYERWKDDEKAAQSLKPITKLINRKKERKNTKEKKRKVKKGKETPFPFYFFFFFSHIYPHISLISLTSFSSSTASSNSNCCTNKASLFFSSSSLWILLLLQDTYIWIQPMLANNSSSSLPSSSSDPFSCLEVATNNNKRKRRPAGTPGFFSCFLH